MTRRARTVYRNGVTEILPAIRLRGRSFMALVLTPEAPAEAWLAALDRERGRAPLIFANRPVIIDFSRLYSEGGDVAATLAALEARELRIIGVEGAPAEALGSETWGRTPLLPALGADKPLVLTEANARDSGADDGETAPPAEPAPPPPSTLLVDEPVRSGQTIFFERGDVIVVGSVAWGAEIIAGGSIHVYGTLRGRAIAGLAGEGRIFCRRFEAELVAIDGYYQTTEDLAEAWFGKPVQISLEAGALRFAPLD